MEPSSEGLQHIKRFLGAQWSVEEAKRALRSAECELSNAEAALAKWLAPADMKPGEKIAVWAGDSLFQVESVPVDEFSLGNGTDGPSIHVRHELRVTVRTRGKHHHELG